MTDKVNQAGRQREFVELEIDGPVARIWLSRPDQGNGLHLGLLKQLQAHLFRVDNSDEVAIVVISGRGETFSTGGQASKAKPWLELSEVR
jgi:methylglutaconyl-CoA hydratase